MVASKEISQVVEWVGELVFYLVEKLEFLMVV